MTKGRPWIRLYTEVPNDPKVQRLPAGLFKFWINCLCLAGVNDGFLPTAPDLAWTLKLTLLTVLENLNVLLKAGLIEETERGRFQPHAWKERQYESDTSNDRVKRFRERQRNVTRAVTVTSPDTEQIQSRAEQTQNSASGPVSRSFRAFWERWCSVTGRKQRESMACQAWVASVEFETEAAAMACLERYGASDEVQRGVVCNPDRWIYDQARDKLAGEWQPRKREAKNGIVGDMERYLDEH